MQAIWHNRFLIVQLTKRDFQNRYLGSYLGLPWAFIKPLAVVFVMWLAFTYGLKIGKVDNSVPFAMWLVIGIIPWFYVSDNIIGSTGSLQEYSFLIKNISFRPSIIPLIKILSNSLIHLFFLFILAIIAVAYDYAPSFHWIQAIYYMFCSIVLILGISWFSSSVQLFMRDMGHLIEVAIQLFFWGTPIIWSYKMLSEKFYSILKLNPIGRYTDRFYGYHNGGRYYFLCECSNPECLLSFLNPQLNVEESAALYDQTLSTSFVYPETDELETNIQAYSYVADLVKKWRNPPAFVIEIGPAQGYTLAALKRAEYKVVGIESSSEWRNIARTITQIPILSSLDDLKPNQYADAVVMWHVLEHIPDPLNFLLNLKNHLSDKLLLFIQVSSHEHTQAFKNSFRGSQVLCEVHVNYFTRYSLINLLWKAGFSILDVRIDNPPYFFMTIVAVLDKESVSPSKFS